MLKSILIISTLILINFSFAKDSINLPIQYIPENLNPAKANDTNGQFILNNAIDGLVSWNYKDGIYPEIAESWIEESDGNLVFNLRNNIKSFEGLLVNCSDILEVFLYNKNLNGPFASIFNKISAKCINNKKLSLKSKMSTKDLLSFLASTQGKLLKIVNNKVIFGLGPFDIKIGKGLIRLIKNKSYHNKHNIFLNEIVLKVIDDSKAIELFKNKELDAILLSNLSGNEKVLKNFKDDLLSINLWTTWGIAFNLKIHPFNNVDLRYCLISNSKTSEWVKSFYPHNLEAYGPIPPGLPGNVNKRYKYIFKKNFSNIKNLLITIPEEIENKVEISKWLKSNFSKCIDEKLITIKIEPFNTMLKLFNENKMGAFLMSFNKETISNDLYFLSFYSSGKENFYNNNSENTKSAFLGLKNANASNISEISNLIAESLAKDAIMIPLMHPIHQVLISKCLDGFVLNPINEGYFLIKNIKNKCN